MPALSEYLLPLCKVGGHLLAQKGASASEELTSAKQAIRLLGGGKPQLHTVQLPTRDQPHYIVTIPKVKKTPKQYPRQVGMPAKTPL
jgi:16S rRNA (guanine527-N7)-methyltransferase